MNKNDSVTLTPKEQQRLQVLNEVLAGRWPVEQAAQVLGLSVRQVWRLLAAYGAGGASSLVHGNRGRPSPRRVAAEVADRVLELVRGPYAGCNDSHLVELLALREGILVGREWLRRLLRTTALQPARPRRAPKHRRRRDRMPQAGMLLQIDGSPHLWLGPEQPRCTLVGGIDDATSEVVAAVFRAQEDGHGYFLLLEQVLRVHGIPLALYHDRHGIFQRERGAPWTLAEQLQGRQEPTQFGRALAELGITSIAARSPEAKGRIERLWGTLQDRLVAELRLANIHDLAAANAFLPAFLERFNARFAVRANDPGQAYRPLDPTLDLARVLSFRYPRVVANDNTVRLDGQVFQVPPGPQRRGYAKACVFVHELLDGSVGVWYQGQWLLRTAPPAQAKPLRARTGPRTHTAPTPAPATPPARQTPPPKAKVEATRWRPPATHPWRRGATQGRHEQND